MEYLDDTPIPQEELFLECESRLAEDFRCYAYPVRSAEDETASRERGYL